MAFYQKWEAYKRGFGSLQTGEFWLGLEKIYQITNSGHYGIDIVLKGRNSLTGYQYKTITLSYKTFRISNEADGYRLTINGFQNNGHSKFSEQFWFHNGMRFSTIDRDNDKWGSDCAKIYGKGSGWWYKWCQMVNLNRGSGPSYTKYKYFTYSKMVLVGKQNNS